jgi:hypothetical protein
VRILLDQNVPVGVRTILREHEVKTAYEMGWATLTNGELLAKIATEDMFEVFVTCDQNLSQQQNLGGKSYSIVVLGSNRWSVILREWEKVLQAVNDSLQPGFIRVVEIVDRPDRRRRRPRMNRMD